MVSLRETNERSLQALEQKTIDCRQTQTEIDQIKDQLITADTKVPSLPFPSSSLRLFGRSSWTNSIKSLLTIVDIFLFSNIRSTNTNVSFDDVTKNWKIFDSLSRTNTKRRMFSSEGTLLRLRKNNNDDEREKTIVINH